MACTFSTSQLPKVVPTWCALYILTWKCASRHNGVHFFDISTSKVVRTWCVLMCLVHFDLETCFAPQWRALFRHLNFQKWSEHGALCTFWLGNVLRATTACTFSTSQLPKVVRTWCVLMCFVHFDLEMCFAPQRRALYRHLNFQSGLRPWVLTLLTWKCASRHNIRAIFHLSSAQLAPHPPL